MNYKTTFILTINHLDQIFIQTTAPGMNTQSHS